MDPQEYEIEEDIEVEEGGEEHLENDSFNGMSEDEFEISASGTCMEDDLFDLTIGKLEDIVVSDEFTSIQQGFMKKYSSEFTDEEENKLIYMDIFQEYLRTIEKYIETHLDVDMNHFGRMLRNRQEEIDGPLFEMLLSFTDFTVFKELMLSNKDSGSLQVSGQRYAIHSDEMTEGEIRMDLDGLCISKIR
ncbi:unnamed protein product [Blepharisma stoltei]|uniref:ADP-ribosylation factor-like protein 2-binding protein n=1 Tax=Blepharisma stoltei TaxID=1481888 RepID=A0AAU9K5Y6_9CILI|nr:unnamed protein product [Blepharisma stoltei]